MTEIEGRKEKRETVSADEAKVSSKSEHFIALKEYMTQQNMRKEKLSGT